MIKKILVIVLLCCGVALSGASQSSSSSSSGLSSSSSASMVVAVDAGVAKSAAASAAANGSADNFERIFFYVPFVGMQGKDCNQRLFDATDQYAVSNVQNIMDCVAEDLDGLRIYGSDQLRCDARIKVMIKISKPVCNNPYAHTIDSFFIAGKSKTEVLGQVALLIYKHETDKGNKKRAALVEGYIRAAMTPAQKVAAATAGKKKKEDDKRVVLPAAASHWDVLDKLNVSGMNATQQVQIAMAAGKKKREEEEAKKKAAQAPGALTVVASSASSSSCSSSSRMGIDELASIAIQTSQQSSAASAAASAAAKK